MTLSTNEDGMHDCSLSRFDTIPVWLTAWQTDRQTVRRNLS